MNNNIITIDMSKWATQKEYAKLVGKQFPAIRQQLKRTKKGISTQPLDYLDIPELNITLIKR